MKIRVFATFLSLLVTLPAQAKRFQNAYVSFDLPPNWNCTLEATEWVCVNDFQQRAKEAIIILTAKQVGPTDSVDAYMQHLRTPRSITNPSGVATPSKVIHVQTRNIANHPWADSLHLGSEVVSYYTRYLGTTKEGIAILVTFSAYKTHYTKYSQDFLRAIDSLRVVATRDLLNKPADAQIRPGNETIGAPIGAHMPAVNEIIPDEPTVKSKSDFYFNVILILFLVSAITIYLFLRSRKKKPQKK